MFTLNHHEDGATNVEYGLIVALIALIIVTSLSIIGDSVDNYFCHIEAVFESVSCSPINITSELSLSSNSENTPGNNSPSASTTPSTSSSGSSNSDANSSSSSNTSSNDSSENTDDYGMTATQNSEISDLQNAMSSEQNALASIKSQYESDSQKLAAFNDEMATAKADNDNNAVNAINNSPAYQQASQAINTDISNYQQEASTGNNAVKDAENKAMADTQNSSSAYNSIVNIATTNTGYTASDGIIN